MKHLPLVPQLDLEGTPSPLARSPIPDEVANGEAASIPRVNQAENNTAFLDEWDWKVDLLNGPPAVAAVQARDGSYVLDVQDSDKAHSSPPSDERQVIVGDHNTITELFSPVPPPGSTTAATPLPTTGQTTTSPSHIPPNFPSPEENHDRNASSSLFLSQTGQLNGTTSPPADQGASSSLVPLLPSHLPPSTVIPPLLFSQALTTPDPISQETNPDAPPPHTTLPDPSSLLFASSPENPLEPLES
ncbi:hypothetical protein BDV98DRAFT_597669, partial [Pterulicium gracile]